MKNVLLSIIAVVLLGALGFGIFAYFDTRDNMQEAQKNTETELQSKEDKKVAEKLEEPQEGQSSEVSVQEEDNQTPSMVEVLRMIDSGEDVNGVVDQEGNTWAQNGDKAVNYTNPAGEKYSSSLSYEGAIDGTDFSPAYEAGDEPEGIFAEEPDPEVVEQLQSEIDNAGLQTELEAKQKELDDYLSSFPE